ncbi:response regulator [Litorivicinus lipolyticus]|uniref:Response regulator n=1 Tax=Litorivicinus lipolyticus TaxID=418701 RepID=A0A5Q2Q9J4_9GAMM|nr:response regulator transcription factor [Litorivicinus lipolyticus]QGG79604.1 response regulator [Litorivicinus lipolyticus]
MSSQLLVVEDDPDQLTNYCHALTRKGWTCRAHADSASALADDSVRPDLALLDVHLGTDADAGFELCRRLIERHPGLPIVFLSSRTDEIDQIFGLRLGAWDYLTKPISMTLLVEKVSAVLKRAAPVTTASIDGDWQVDGPRMRVTYRGAPANLTVTEFAIVDALIHANGAVLDFDQLAERTRQSVVTNNTLSTHIKHIRRKLKTLDRDFDALVSVYGKGYQWQPSD